MPRIEVGALGFGRKFFHRKVLLLLVSTLFLIRDVFAQEESKEKDEKGGQSASPQKDSPEASPTPTVRDPQAQPKKKKKPKKAEEGDEDVPQDWWDSGSGEDGANF